MALITWFHRYYREVLFKRDDFALNMTFWSTVNPDDFHNYRISAPLGRIPPTSNSPAPAPAPSEHRGQGMHIPTFKDLKLDLNYFDDLKSEEQWDTWNHTFKTFATASGYGDLCDITSEIPPTGTPERAKWDTQQRHLYAILLAKVKTSSGRGIVKEHDGDAHAAYKALVAYHQTSIIADAIEASHNLNLSNISI